MIVSLKQSVDTVTYVSMDDIVCIQLSKETDKMRVMLDARKFPSGYLDCSYDTSVAGAWIKYKGNI